MADEFDIGVENTSVDEFDIGTPSVSIAELGLNDEISMVAQEEGVDESVFRAMLQQESQTQHIDPQTGKPKVSSAGAIGIGQVLPSTGEELGFDVMNRSQNLRAAARYLKMQTDYFGNYEQGLTAYHSGRKNVINNTLGPVGKAYAPSVFARIPDAQGSVTPVAEASEFDVGTVTASPQVEDVRAEVSALDMEPLSVSEDRIQDRVQAVKELEKQFMGTSAGRAIVKGKQNDLMQTEGLDEETAFVRALEEVAGTPVDSLVGQHKSTPSRLLGRFWSELKQVPARWARGVRSSVETAPEAIEDRQALMDNPTLEIQNLIEQDQIDPIELSILQNDAADLVKEGYGDKEAQQIAIQRWFARREEHKQNTVAFLKGVEDADIFDPMEGYEEPARAGSMEEVAGVIGSSAAEIPLYAVNPVLGASATYMRIKADLVDDIDARLKETQPFLPDDVRLKIANDFGSLGAGLQTPLEAIGKVTQLATILGKGPFKKFMTGMAATYVGEGLTEYAQQYPEEFAIIWALNPDLSSAELKEFFISKVPEIHKRAMHSASVGAKAGLITAGAGRVALAPAANYISTKQAGIHDRRAKRLRDERAAVQRAELDAVSPELKAVGDMINKPKPETVKEILTDAKERAAAEETGVKFPYKPIKQRASDVWTKVITNFVDRVAPIKQVSEEAYRHAIVYPGRMDRVAGKLTILEEMMTPLKGHQELADRYFAAKRIKSRAQQEVSSGIRKPVTGKTKQVMDLFGVESQGITMKATLEDQIKLADKAISDIESTWVSMREGTALFDKATGENVAMTKEAALAELRFTADNWNDFMFTELVEPAHASGFISDEAFVDLVNRHNQKEFYVTFDVVNKVNEFLDKAGVPEGDIMRDRRGVKTETFSPMTKDAFQKQYGTDKMIDSPTDATLRKLIQSNVLFERNGVVQRLVTDPNSRDVVRPLTRNKKEVERYKAENRPYKRWDQIQPNEESIVVGYENGNPVEYVVDKDVAVALEHMSGKQMNEITKLLKPYNDLFRRTATVWNPGFTTTNIWRDAYLTYIASPAHKPLGMTREFATGLVKGEGLRGAMKRAGRQRPFFMDYISGFMESAKHTIKGTGDAGIDVQAYRRAERGEFEQRQLSLYERHLASGAGFGWTKSEIRNRKDVGKVVFKDKKKRSVAGLIIRSPKALMDTIEKVNEAFEFAPRIAVTKAVHRALNTDIIEHVRKQYEPQFAQINEARRRITQQGNPNIDLLNQQERALEQRMRQDLDTTAAFIARASGIDFNRGGTLIKAMNQYIPFLNARVQGSATLLRSLSPFKHAQLAKEITVSKNAKMATVDSWAKWMMVNTVPTAAAWAWNQTMDPDGELDRDVPNYIKNNYWRFYLGYEVNKDGVKEPRYFLIPKGEAGKLSNFFEGFLDENYDGDPRMVEYVLDLIDAFSPVEVSRGPAPAIGSLLPPAVKAVLEPVAGYDLFRAHEIETRGMEDKPVFARFKQSTPQIYKWMSQAIFEAKEAAGLETHEDEWYSPLRLQKMAENVFTIYGREGGNPKEILTAALERNIRTKGGQLEQDVWKEVNILNADYDEMRYEAQGLISKGFEDDALDLILDWNDRAESELDKLEPKLLRLEERGHEFLSMEGIRKDYTISMQEIQNWLKGDLDSRTALEKRIEGRGLAR